MSKVDELKQKYSSVTNVSLNKFIDADKTQTKKYLDFMLKTWEDRKIAINGNRTVSSIIGAVNKFNELIPYIENKDIYSKEYYGNFQNLLDTINRAETIKDDKSFNREEHAKVLLETKDLLFIQPITRKGSIKYGANTKWCTTSKTDPNVFNRYFKDGLLVYLIDKTDNKAPNFRKIAFYLEYSKEGLNTSIIFYNTLDSSVQLSTLINNGWSEDVLFEIVSLFRYFFIKTKKLKNSRDYVDSFVATLSRLDFKKLEENLTKLEEGTNVSYINDVREKVEEFLKTLNNSKYGIRKTKD